MKVLSFLKHSNCSWHNWYFYYIYNRNVNKFYLNLNGTKVYDFGAGDEYYRSVLEDLGYIYKSVDWANSDHDSNPDIDANLNLPLPLANDSVEHALCWSVLEHLSKPGDFLKELSRVLKPGGSLLLQTPFMWQVHEAPHDYFRFTNFGLLLLLEEARLHVKELKPQSGVCVMLTMKFLYQLKRIFKSKGFMGISQSLYVISVPLYLIAALTDQITRSESETTGYLVQVIKLDDEVNNKI